jgi:diketogulonate reductase-like aldo/keto reductase
VFSFFLFTVSSGGGYLLQIGLGTGGIPHEEAFDVFSEALNLGYRLFDLAREYGNEHIMREALRSWYQKGR